VKLVAAAAGRAFLTRWRYLGVLHRAACEVGRPPTMKKPTKKSKKRFKVGVEVPIINPGINGGC
jgi:hypothetical protein